MPLSRTRFFLSAVAVAALSAGSALGTTNVYTASSFGGSGWTSSITAGSLNDLGLNVPGSLTAVPEWTFGSFIFDGANADGSLNAGVTLSNSSGNLSATAGGAIKVTAPGAGVNAFALLLPANPGGLVITLSDGEAFTLNSNVWWGLSISHDVTWFTVSNSSGSPVIGDMVIGNSSLTQDAPTTGAPEGGTILLVGAGLVFLGKMRRRIAAAAAF